jgi:hypothetical protein
MKIGLLLPLSFSSLFLTSFIHALKVAVARKLAMILFYM